MFLILMSILGTSYSSITGHPTFVPYHPIIINTSVEVTWNSEM